MFAFQVLFLFVQHSIDFVDKHKLHVTTRGPFEGGDQERALAATVRQWEQKTINWPRTTSLLEHIATNWERHAEDEDLRAKQDEMRFS
jgi:hypothetical protein